MHSMLQEAAAAKSTAASAAAATAAAATVAAGGLAAAAAGSGAGAGAEVGPGRVVERAARNLVSNIASIRRKLEGAGARGSKAEALQGARSSAARRKEWAEGGERSRTAVSSRAAADAIFSSLDDGDV